MEHYTVGRNYNSGKIAYAKCVAGDTPRVVDIKDKCFVMIIMTEGVAAFACGGDEFIATAPCFICFSECDVPVIKYSRKFKSETIYFHPQYLNINMTFDMIRSTGYDDIAHRHDMFLLKPFLDKKYVVPITENYIEKLAECFSGMKAELEAQYDWYWSCRSRTYFMEIIIILERLYGYACKSDNSCNNPAAFENEKLKKSIMYMESHYSVNITLSDIVKAAKTNHTTLTQLFKQELSVTPIEYLWKYRINIAKKHLAFSEIPPKEIALRCGFKTAQHFSRIFKEETGTTPLSYRKDSLESRKREIRR